MIIKRRQIIKQGGSCVVAISPRIMRDNGFALGDVVDMTITHNKEFDASSEENEKLFARLLAAKMKKENVDTITFELKKSNKETNEETNKETKQE